MNSVYAINKGVHQPIVFKGLKGQWILYLAGGLVALFWFLLFVICWVFRLLFAVWVYWCWALFFFISFIGAIESMAEMAL